MCLRSRLPVSSRALVLIAFACASEISDLGVGQLLALLRVDQADEGRSGPYSYSYVTPATSRRQRHLVTPHPSRPSAAGRRGSAGLDVGGRPRPRSDGA